MTTPTAQPFHSATRAFADGTDTPRDFLERCLLRLDEYEPNIAAFVHLNREGARAAADRSSERWRAGRPLSRIDGMPLGIKDIMETADMPTEMGSPLFKGWRSDQDAAAVAALREAGGVILGKTVTTEFAASVAGPTRNPWDHKRTPGGSSSGSAAAVGAGILPAALGTQVIGSILRPASFCGCVGFKPSVGAVNRGGSHDRLSQSSTGVLAATIEDGWDVLWAIVARTGGDPGWPGLAGPERPAPQQPHALARIETAGWALASDAAKAELEGTIAQLRARGVKILERSDEPLLAEIEPALNDVEAQSRRINAWESRWPLNTYRDRNAGSLSRFMLDRLAQAEAMTPDQYRQVIAERARVRALYARLAAVCDGCITLSAIGPAPEGLQSTGNASFAVPSSFLGVPSLSLPVLRTEGLPLGLQLMGFEQADAALIGAAQWIDGALAGRPTQA